MRDAAELRAQELWADLADLLTHKLESVEGAGEQQALYQELIAVQRDQLGDGGAAYQTALAGLRALPQSAVIAEALTALLEVESRWEDALSEVTQYVMEKREPDDGVPLWLLLATWYGDHLRHYEYAVHSCEMALQLAPDDPKVRAELDRFQQAAERRTS